MFPPFELISSSFHTDYVTALAWGGWEGVGEREREWCCSGHTVTIWHTYGHTKTTSTEMCLLIICLLLLASQHLPLSCFYSDFFLHTQTHNHAQMFINDVQDIPAAVNQPLRNLLYVKKPWQLFSSISHTHTHTYTWKETHRISIFSLFEDPLLSRIWQAASLSIQPPAKPGLLINTSQCKQDKPAALPVAHLSESPAETNAESRRMHVNPHMLMLEVNPNWQRDKFACSVTGWNLLTQLWFTLKESVWK